MILNKITLTVVVTLFFMSLKAQELRGSAYYSVLKLTDSVNNAADELWMLDAYPYVPEVAALLEFKLEFTPTSSLFTLVKNKNIGKIGKEELKTTTILIGYKDSTWQDLEYYYNYDRDLSKGLDPKGLFIKDRNNFEWTVTDETKNIGKFTCYKALGYRVEGVKNIRKRPVVAWFCPEIVVPFGPIYSRDLPGLIFEYQYGGNVYGLTQIKWDKNLVIPSMPKKEILTRDEWRDRLYELGKEINK